MSREVDAGSQHFGSPIPFEEETDKVRDHCRRTTTIVRLDSRGGGRPASQPRWMTQLSDFIHTARCRLRSNGQPPPATVLCRRYELILLSLQLRVRTTNTDRLKYFSFEVWKYAGKLVRARPHHRLLVQYEKSQLRMRTTWKRLQYRRAVDKLTASPLL